MSRKLFLLLGTFDVEACHTIHRDTVDAIIVVLFVRLGLVVIVVGSETAAWAAIFAIEQTLVGIEGGQVVGSGIYGSGRVGNQVITNMGESALHFALIEVWSTVVVFP